MKPRTLNRNIQSVDDLEQYYDKTSQSLKLSTLGHLKSDHVKKYIVPFLRLHPEITKVDLSWNQVDDAGAIALADIPLKTLVMNHNNIGAKGAEVLFASKTLTTLELAFNKCDNKADKEAINEAIQTLARNKIINKLVLSHFGVGPAGAKILAAHPTINELELGFSEIGKEQVEALEKSRIERVYITSSSVAFFQKSPMSYWGPEKNRPKEKFHIEKKIGIANN